MKKISSKTIKGILITSGVVTMGVCMLAFKDNVKTNNLLIDNDITEVKEPNVLGETENQVKLANAKVEEAQAEVKKANEAIEKAEQAKEEAQAQVKVAKTEAERKVAEEKVKAMEEEIKKANDVKTEALNNVKKAEDNRKLVEEQVKKEVKTTTKEENEESKKQEVKVQENVQKVENAQPETKTEESTSENRSLPQWALDAAARNEQKAKDELAALEAKKAEDAAKAKAEREAKAADEERARKEREAWEADIKKQSDVVNGYDTYDKEYHFSSVPSNAAEEEYIKSLNRVKSNVSGITNTHGSITVAKSEGTSKGQIWWVEMSCNLTMCEGFTGHFNTAKVSVRLEGLRDSINSITLIAPNAKKGYKFVGWKTYNVRYNDEINIRGYEAVYEKM